MRKPPFVASGRANQLFLTALRLFLGKSRKSRTKVKKKSIFAPSPPHHPLRRFYMFSTFPRKKTTNRTHLQNIEKMICPSRRRKTCFLLPHTENRHFSTFSGRSNQHVFDLFGPFFDFSRLEFSQATFPINYFLTLLRNLN